MESLRPGAPLLTPAFCLVSLYHSLFGCGLYLPKMNSATLPSRHVAPEQPVLARWFETPLNGSVVDERNTRKLGCNCLLGAYTKGNLSWKPLIEFDMGQSWRLGQEDSLDEESVCRSQSYSEDNHGSAVLFDVAVEVAVVSQLAVAEGKGADRNSMAVADMEDLAAVVTAHSSSVGRMDNCRHGVEHVPPGSVDVVAVAASERGVMLAKAVQFGEVWRDQ